MKTLKNFLVLSLFIIFASACKSDPLEDYFVNATESSDFFVVNIPANVVEFDTKKLDPETIRQIKSIKKVNVLLYKNDFDTDVKKHEFEKAQKAVKSKAYKSLTRINNKGYRFSFAYQGKPDKIDEVILLGKDSDYNFAIALIKGKGINVNNFAKAVKHIKKVDDNQAKSIIEMMIPKKKNE